MKRTLLPVLGGFLAVSLALAEDAPAKKPTYLDKTNGFSMEAPGGDFTTAAQSRVATFFAGSPRKDRVASATVTVEMKKTTRKEHLPKLLAELERGGATDVKSSELQVSGKDALQIEHRQRVRQPESILALRFLTLVVFKEDRLFVVVFVSPEEDWKDLEAGFRASLASFKLDE